MRKARDIFIFCALLVVVLAIFFARTGVAKAPKAFLSLFEFKTRVLVLGDLFFDRYIRQTIDTRGGDYVFSCVDDVLRDSDLTVGNLEGPITDHPSVSVGTKP